MKIRVIHSTDPSATISIGTDTESSGHTWVEERDLSIALSHGFIISHPPTRDPTPEEKRNALKLRKA